MFRTNNPKIKSGSVAKTYDSGRVLPILTAAELLNSSRHQGLLRELRSMAGMKNEEYDRFYGQTLKNFAEFVQVMPTVAHGPLSNLLNEGISLAAVAIKAYIALDEAVDPLVMYAVFTAALFRDIARVVTNHKVILCEEGGAFIDEWVPFAGTMVALDRVHFYKLYPLAPIYQRLDKSLTPLLARQLMSKEGFLWIASDLQLFADWLDVLTDEGVRGGRVSHVLSTVRPQDVFNLMNALVQVPIELKQSMDTHYGDLFFAWLKEGIAQGTIAVNTADAGVHITTDGVFLELNKLVDQFEKITKLPVNRAVVVTQFGNLLGIASKGGGDFMNAQYFSKSVGMGDGAVFSSPLSSRLRSLNGMVISDSAVVIMNKDNRPSTTEVLLKGASSKIPATHQVPVQSSALGQAPSMRNNS